MSLVKKFSCVVFIHVFIISVFCISSLRAEVPKAPLNFSVRVEEQHQVQVIILEWNVDTTGAKPTGYDIHSTNGSIHAPFKTGQDTLEHFRYEYRHYPTGTYSFDVDFFNKDGVGPISQTQTISIVQLPLFYIKSSPSLVAQVGKQYKYVPQLVNLDSVQIMWLSKYFFYDFDLSTGTITWMPDKAGIFDFEIQATCLIDPILRDKQNWSVLVTEGNPDNPCAIIQGKVRDQNAQSITRGVITAVLVDDGHGGSGSLTTSNINNGQYTIFLKSSGTYILRAAGLDFHTKWYDNDTTVADAKRIQVNCNDSLSIDFDVAKKKTIFFKGKVVSGIDGKFIRAAVRIRTKDGTFLDSVLTKNDCSYLCKIPEGFECTVQAHIYEPNHRMQFFNGTTDYTQSTGVTSIGDSIKIDFASTPHNVINDTILGLLRNDSSRSLDGFVIAYRIPANGGPPNQDSAITVASQYGGLFVIRSLVPGNYILYAVSMDGVCPSKSWLPGYFKANSSSVDSWQDATIIPIVANGSYKSAFISLKKRDGEQGVAKLVGDVSNTIGGFTGDHDNLFSNKSLAGALIKIVDQNNKVSDFGFSDRTGLFSLNDASIGNLSVIASRIGFDSYQTNVQFDLGSKSIIQTSIQLQPTVQTNVDESINLTYEKDFHINAYPNPATSKVIIRFSENAAINRLKIYNQLGNELYSQNIDGVNSKNQILLNVERLPSGIYYVRVEGLRGSKSILLAIIH